MSSWIKKTPEARALFVEEKLTLAATEMIYAAMESAGKNKRDLADLLKVRPSEISQRLSGRRNLTLRSLARMMNVLGFEVELNAVPIDSQSESLPFERQIGTRVSKQVPETAGENSHLHIYRAVMCARLVGQVYDPKVLKEHTDHVWNVLETLDHVVSASVHHESNDVVQVTLDVTAADTMTAMKVSNAAIRTAIHTAEGGTPGWEREAEDWVSDVEFKVAKAPDSPSSQVCSA